ncbi:hypothetical protein XA68_15308 [Ophiocordyceps unilateralis]|uniref:Peptidase M14 domain-containing protein n=1 Tax=Ophiocordyceps unilateralis TaxID=268505 RepID=A0A2A9P6X8_OPHUN|nr:hypothetical protein XA68_15308 [Ophiocordyceps unilateralis]
MKPATIILLATHFALYTSGYLNPDEGDAGSTIVHQQPSIEEMTTAGVSYFPVGRGDRFRNVVPRGFGSTADFEAASILSVTEIESALQGLQKTYPDKMMLNTTGIKTHEGRDIFVAVMGSDSPRVLLVSGIHGRDRGGPDNLVYLMSDLLWADRNNASLHYDSKEYSIDQVRQILAAGIALIPSANPDGLNYDQTTNSCWRKNRRPATNRKEVGVDINVNFNVFWDFENMFHQNTTKIAMSRDARKQNYVGPEPLSEPETRSIYNLLRDMTSLSWYLDLHSVRGEVLYSWGDDSSQTEDPSMNHLNATYNRQRGIPDDAYREYLEPEDFYAQKSVAERMVEVMNSVGDEAFYQAAESASLYASPGSTDEAMAKYYSRKCGANRINVVRLNFGKEVDTLICQDFFYPDAHKYHQNLLQTTVGLMEFLLNAAGQAGERKLYHC